MVLIIGSKKRLKLNEPNVIHGIADKDLIVHNNVTVLPIRESNKQEYLKQISQFPKFTFGMLMNPKLDKAYFYEVLMD